MSTIRFRAGTIDLELHGAESFIIRQLELLAPLLGSVDSSALAAGIPEEKPEASGIRGVAKAEHESLRSELAAAGGGDGDDKLVAFYRSIAPNGRDRQADAALLFAYYLQQREGRKSLALGDLIRCCIRAGVDTRNFNRTLGTLTRRGLLQPVLPGRDYLLSEQGLAAVESRM